MHYPLVQQYVCSSSLYPHAAFIALGVESYQIQLHQCHLLLF